MSEGNGLEDDSPKPSEKSSKKFLKPLDKPLALWYNKRAEGRCGQHQGLNRIEKISENFFSKPLDKPHKVWYNKDAPKRGKKDRRRKTPRNQKGNNL